jgi:hypothetical protein
MPTLRKEYEGKRVQNIASVDPLKIAHIKENNSSVGRIYE